MSSDHTRPCGGRAACGWLSWGYGTPNDAGLDADGQLVPGAGLAGAYHAAIT